MTEPICIEPTISGTKYIFTLNGRVSGKELDQVDDGDDTDSSGEDADSDGETEVHTNAARANAYPKVVFFGTGSSFPGVTKSVTAILVHTA